MKSTVNKKLDLARARVQHDEHARQIVSDKYILAEILAGTVKEFQGMKREEILPLIEGEPKVSCIPLEPGEALQSQITGMANENQIPNESKVFFDVRTYVHTPDRQELVKIILDLELQKEYYPGYDLVSRGVVYGARMLSSQIDTEFSIPDYDGVKKVYSIFLCMNCPCYAKNTTTAYQMQPQDIEGHFPWGKNRYDLLTVVMVRLAGEISEGQSRLHRLLSTLFHTRMANREKIRILKEEYGIPMAEETERRVNKMADVLELMMEEGMELGEAKGRAEARGEDIKITVRMLRSLQIPNEAILEQLIKEFELTEEEAVSFMN